MTGEAISRFLAALGRTDPPSAGMPPAPAYKRYPDATRIGLDGVPGDLGDLLRGLLGISRVGWDHTERPGDTVVIQRRPVASGGARYPMEAYVADSDRLSHYDPAHHSLEVIREGDHRGVLADGTPDLVIVLTAVFWRTAVRYGDFAYRLLCQETGALAAQFLALADRQGRQGSLVQLFDGRAVAELLGVDADAEGVMALLTWSRPIRPNAVRPAEPASGDLAGRPDTEPAEPVPRVTRILPALLALHAAPVSGAGAQPPDLPVPAASGQCLPSLQPVPLHQGIRTRTSTHQGFATTSIDSGTLSRLLAAANGGYPSALPGTTDGPKTCVLYVVALRVAGVRRGAYRYHRGRLVACAGEVAAPPPPARVTLAALAAGEAAAVILPTGDPFGGVEEYGDAWYRIQQIEVGSTVHRASLAAAALGLTSRVHSDFCHPRTDDALDLPSPSWRSLSALFVGAVPQWRTPVRWTVRSN